VTRLLAFGLLLAGASMAAQAAAPRTRVTLDFGRGKRLFQGHCARCHGIKGQGGTGADLTRPVYRHAPNAAGIVRVIKGGINGTAMPGNWFLTDREILEVTRYVGSLKRSVAEPLPGDRQRGMKLFTKHECSKCHIVDGGGGSVGPDLSDIGARRGLEFLRIAVMHPGKDMPLNEKGYAAYLVVVAVTKEGRVLTGTRINEDTFTIQLRDEKNRIYSLNKRDLEDLKKTAGSLMPSYEEKLSQQDVDDLLTYLARLRGTP